MCNIDPVQINYTIIDSVLQTQFVGVKNHVIMSFRS
jgi:hypothetical protein